MSSKKEFSSKSLLRYPGGKTRAVEEIVQYFPKGIKEIASPFFGGGSIEVYMAASGVKVHGYDIFPPLVEFWQCAIQQPGELADEVEKHYPLAKDKFYELQKIQTLFKSKIERAAVFYVLNRASFSGSTLSGGMSPHHPRFTITSIERLRRFYNPNLEVKKAHFRNSITANNNNFLYLDPPYLLKSTLYGKKGDTHKGFDHDELCALLKERDYWIMSYNNCKEIREMYDGFKIIEPQWKYGMSGDKSSKEVLIFSKDL